MEKSTVLKTSFRGFDKKAVMDYIEQLQAENMALKDRISELESRLSDAAPVEEAPKEEAPAAVAETPVEEPAKEAPAAEAVEEKKEEPKEEAALPKDDALASLAAEFAPKTEEAPKEEPKEVLAEDQIAALEKQLEDKLSALVSKYAEQPEEPKPTIGGSKGYRIKVKIKEDD